MPPDGSFYRVSCIMVRSTHNARNSTAHGVRLTQQILLHYGRNRNAKESVGGGDGAPTGAKRRAPIAKGRTQHLTKDLCLGTYSLTGFASL